MLLNERIEVGTGIFRSISEDIIEAYLADQRFWVLGFSGGKDSTALLQLTYYSIAKLPNEKRKKHIYVIASDTRVEMPHISARVRIQLDLISASAERDGLPISTHLVYPKLNDTFWVNLIGRGYPSPNSRFRWCTDRLKIHPVSEFIRSVVNKSGSVIVVLGTRKDESSTRAQSMNRNDIKGSRFRPHQDLPKAYVYTPIQDATANEIWTYLLNVPNPWDGDNQSLVELYKQASGECPLIIDRSTPSCGHSRFGCWTCTVVEKDKSIESLIFAGDKQLIPLLELRDYLREVRSKPGARYDQRRNGSIPKRRGTNEIMSNTGPFTHETRMEVLKCVLEAQKESGLRLVGGDELTIIQEIWNKEENKHPSKPVIPTDAVVNIWKHVSGEEPMPNDTEKYNNLDREDRLFRKVCESHDIPFEMMRRLRDVEEEYGHLRRRHGLPEQMREIIQQFISE